MMQSNPFKIRRTAALATAAFAGGMMSIGGAHAATATATVPVVLSVLAPLCSVTNGNTTVYLPPVSSQSITQNQWLTANAITTAAQLGNTWSTSAALNQTATIACDSPTVSILGVTVQPGSSATTVPGYSGTQYLVGGAATPAKAAGGNLQMIFEQVAINGAAVPYSYVSASGAAVQAYSTLFNTTSVGASSSTATVVWRPAFSNNQPATAIGNPTGGSYVGSAQIVVNY